MANRKQRERMRQARLAFDAEVAKNLATKETLEAIGKMTKKQLIEYAESNNIEIDKKAKKEEIANIIRNKVIE